MQDVQSLALVLRLDPTDEYDSRVTLFTREYGKVVARIKSARKITSKLTPHLQPGYLSRVRLIAQRGLHIADALRENMYPEILMHGRTLDALLGEEQEESLLFDFLTTGSFAWREILKLLGLDPTEASCEGCGRDAEGFLVHRHQFVCKRCASRAKQGEVVWIL
jgi:recombinational DNA repair protein (RecF pathway)